LLTGFLAWARSYLYRRVSLRQVYGFFTPAVL
jgi:hypothetical protein